MSLCTIQHLMDGSRFLGEEMSTHEQSQALDNPLSKRPLYSPQVTGTQMLGQSECTITSPLGAMTHAQVKICYCCILQVRCVPVPFSMCFRILKAVSLIAVIKQENYDILSSRISICIRLKTLLNIFKNLTAQVLVPRLLLDQKQPSPNPAFSDVDIAFHRITGTFPTPKY